MTSLRTIIYDYYGQYRDDSGKKSKTLSEVLHSKQPILPKDLVNHINNVSNIRINHVDSFFSKYVFFVTNNNEIDEDSVFRLTFDKELYDNIIDLDLKDDNSVNDLEIHLLSKLFSYLCGKTLYGPKSIPLITIKNNDKTIIKKELCRKDDDTFCYITKKLTPVVVNRVSKGVIERKKWKAFIHDTRVNNSSNADSTGSIELTDATVVWTDVPLEILVKGDTEDVAVNKDKEQGNLSKEYGITCRFCKKIGQHFSAKCPDRAKYEMQETASTPSTTSASNTKFVPSFRKNISENGGKDRFSIKIDNVPDTADDYSLREIFGRFGRICRVAIPKFTDEYGNTNIKGYAFITYDSLMSANDAIKHMHKCRCDGAILNVEMARDQ